MHQNPLRPKEMESFSSSLVHSLLDPSNIISASDQKDVVIQVMTPLGFTYNVAEILIFGVFNSVADKGVALLGFSVGLLCFSQLT